MKEVIERWERSGKVKSITYYTINGKVFDKLIFNEQGEYVKHKLIYDLHGEYVEHVSEKLESNLGEQYAIMCVLCQVLSENISESHFGAFVKHYFKKILRAHACGPRGTDRLNPTPPPI